MHVSIDERNRERRTIEAATHSLNGVPTCPPMYMWLSCTALKRQSNDIWGTTGRKANN